MKIKEIQLTNFKRFTKTKFAKIPATARLVVLVGPNGCGKSSLIDGVNVWYRNNFAHWSTWDRTYHRKQIPGVAGKWNKLVSVKFHDPQPGSDEQCRKAIYVRSAYRNDPDFKLNELSDSESAVDEFRIERLIENDETVGLNYKRLVSQGFEDVFERALPDLTIREFREQSIGEIRKAMLQLFPDLELNSLGNPLVEATFLFDKGDSKRFQYKNLSGGEKAAFDLLLDILIKRKEFDDTVFFIDEPEAHLAPRLQSALLNQLFEAVPLNSQLWLATHSIGMIRRARELAHINPDTVVFLDFDGVNFDIPQTVTPTEPDRSFWKRAMQVALDDLAGYVTPECVVLCEGGLLQDGTDFDAECYNTIFEVDYPQTVFLGAGDSNNVLKDPRGIGRLLGALAPNVRVTRVIDRDDRTAEEVRKLQVQQVRVLSLRTIESYLLDDSVLRELCREFGKPKRAKVLLKAKGKALQSSVDNNGPADDLKRPAGDIYNAAKRLFPDRKLGGDKRAFMKGLCAPLVRRTSIYKILRKDIFGGR